MATHKAKVLFLSTGDAARGLIAEGFLRSLAGEQFDIVSSSVKAGTLDPLAGVVMKEAGIDITGQKSKTIAYSLKQHFGHVVAIFDLGKERSPIFPFSLGIVHWNIVDPNSATGLPEQKAEVFRHVRDEIKNKVIQFVADTAKTVAHELSIA